MHRAIASWFGSGLLLGKIRGSHAGSGTVGSAVALIMTIAIGQVRVEVATARCARGDRAGFVVRQTIRRRWC